MEPQAWQYHTDSQPAPFRPNSEDPSLIGMHIPEQPIFPVPWSSQEVYIYDATGRQIADCMAADNSKDGGSASHLARAIVIAVNQKYVVKENNGPAE